MAGVVRIGFKSPNQQFPVSPRELPVNLDFTKTAIITDDLGPEMQQSQIEFIQSVWIDNSNNADIMTIQFNNGQNIEAQPGSQGVYPVISSGLLRYVAQSAGGVIVPVIFS